MSELQGIAHEITDEARKAIQRARKILDMASRPPSDDDSPAQREAKERERAVAAEKFQAVLLEYNLTQAMVEQAGGETDGRREEAKLKAGVYEWQRNLWEAVAELNFCLYFCQDVWREQTYTKTLWDGSKAKRTRYVRGKEHRVIGRVVNTQATINLCQYIEAAIEQATRERLREAVGSDDKQALNRMLFSRYAVSFREGAADDVIGRVNDQRQKVLAEEARKAREARARQDEAAASGVSDGTALVLGVDYYACKGYDSQTMSWQAGRRMARYIAKGQRPIIFHLGDHDPSGLDMTRDNRERLETFAGVPITVVRLALNMDQIEELDPPPNPAKMTDSRATAYVEQFGESSWEIDALPPTYIRDLIDKNVSRLRDEDAWGRALAREVAGKEWLRTIQRPEREEDEL